MTYNKQLSWTKKEDEILVNNLITFRLKHAAFRHTEKETEFSFTQIKNKYYRDISLYNKLIREKENN